MSFAHSVSKECTAGRGRLHSQGWSSGAPGDLLHAVEEDRAARVGVEDPTRGAFGGMMVWALDQADPGTASLLNPDGMTGDEVLEAESIYQDEAAKGLCYTTKCGDKCRDGDHEAAQANGQPGQYSTESRCPSDEYRRIRRNKGVTMGTCRWRGRLPRSRRRAGSRGGCRDCPGTILGSR
ncbi:hypothetical protein INS49_007328 [Diaporthe citri]|uniref:uncharacterized protein n=1 Tax=Diaporthe citri TaxID=83186 RepID=UPI001C7FB660|nr:uncharacterized protein INS49_007328 [Diaporthe citri]KAG6365717.1 hypothetical protein INS49_007328 [Diaporthe citri]